MFGCVAPSAASVVMPGGTVHSDETQLAELTVSRAELIPYAYPTGMHMGGGFGCWSTTFKDARPYKFSNLYVSETVKKRDSQEARPGQCRGSALTLHKEIYLRSYRKQCVADKVCADKYARSEKYKYHITCGAAMDIITEVRNMLWQ